MRSNAKGSDRYPSTFLPGIECLLLPFCRATVPSDAVVDNFRLLSPLSLFHIFMFQFLQDRTARHRKDFFLAGRRWLLVTQRTVNSTTYNLRKRLLLIRSDLHIGPVRPLRRQQEHQALTIMAIFSMTLVHRPYFLENLEFPCSSTAKSISSRVILWSVLPKRCQYR